MLTPTKESQAFNEMFDPHPAIAAHNRGHSLTYAVGSDWIAYLVSVDQTEYLVTVWADGRIGVQTI